MGTDPSVDCTVASLVLITTVIMKRNQEIEQALNGVLSTVALAIQLVFHLNKNNKK